MSTYTPTPAEQWLFLDGPLKGRLERHHGGRVTLSGGTIYEGHLLAVDGKFYRVGVSGALPDAEVAAAVVRSSGLEPYAHPKPLTNNDNLI